MDKIKLLQDNYILIDDSIYIYGRIIIFFGRQLFAVINFEICGGAICTNMMRKY